MTRQVPVRAMAGRERRVLVIATVATSFVTELVAAYAAAPPKPLPGVPEALAARRAAGVHVALTTGFDRQVTEPLLAAVGWDVPGTLDARRLRRRGDRRPPGTGHDPRGDGPARRDRPGPLVAGDTVLDVRAGRAAGAGLVIGVLTGAQGPEELGAEAPTRVLDGVAELPVFLGLTRSLA
ncbi:hypothetical protein BJF90_41255 [Pseudonocardia sp. CNS-004]|nr:hypothetical protein BJF90_41255 [Pseudonocardia sp. CNS-004]